MTKDGDADYLITGDHDLLVMEKFEKTKIISLNDFEIAAADKKIFVDTLPVDVQTGFGIE